MAQKRDYYEVLGVERTASSAEIATAYRNLARKHHPDRNPGDQEAIVRFKEAAEAFEVLHDAKKRERYDRYGHAGVEGGAPHFADVEDIFQHFGDIFGGGIFGDLFGGRRSARSRKGADIHCEVTIDLMKAARGTTETISFKRHRPCDECHATGAAPGSQPETCRYCGGRGRIIQSSGILRVQTTCPSCRGSGQTIKQRCPKCNGEAYILEKIEQKLTIPRGIDDQMQVRIPGEGEPSPEGGPPGDCYCLVHVREHPLFRRDGNHLICRVPVTFAQAALGATISVPTLDGPEDVEIPGGTQPEDVLTLKRRGMPDPRGGTAGDLHVQIDLEVPRKLDPRQEELIRQLAEVESTSTTPHRKSFLEKLKDYFVVDNESAQPQRGART